MFFERIKMSVVLAEEVVFSCPEIEPSFELMAKNLAFQGYSLHLNGLNPNLLDSLYEYIQTMPADKFKRAGIGREDNLILNESVRTDQVCWINGESEAGQDWLNWTASLQRYLNRNLFLGLFSFESHFAHYSTGDFYKTHKDAFKGEANRILSVVVYLNPDWKHTDGGELVLYQDQTQVEILRVVPNFGTVVAFLSEDFPHEVLPATRDRYSIAGWFRVNSSAGDKVDPPR